MCAHPAPADDRITVIYEFRVRGHLGQAVLRGWDELQAETDGEDTVLKGPVVDQAALHGVLVQIEALGLELLELRRIPVEATDQRVCEKEAIDRQ
jgi:hypothetical protein